MIHDKVSTNLDFVSRELEVLQYWREHGIFQKSIDNRRGCPVYTFYDGPPTANGKPHIGHVLTRAIKDIIPRYQTMKGNLVLRKAGWDTHGLPVELEVEKQLGLDGKPQVEQYGIEPFIEKCKQSVWKYKGDWEELSERVAFWADMEDPYITYEDDYIESVWWAIKTIADKDLLYKGFKVVPYCPRCGTALSSHEVAQGYQDVEETSLTARFAVHGRPNTYILAWTTTPWTLPSNCALCINPALEYAQAQVNGDTLILARDLVPTVLGEQARVTRTFPGSELLGVEYEPLYHAGCVPDGQQNRVVGDEYVSTAEGTGVVHIAPYGEDDMRILAREGLQFNLIVDTQGNFTATTPWNGIFVKDADPAIVEDLRARGLLLASFPYAHSYPFCWRCDTPLLYYPRDTWFIRMTAVREELIANNRSINWLPDHIKEGRMGNFLENVIDWGVSRERYWGTPLPVWLCECGHRHVVGSRAELEQYGIDVPHDLELHKPFIDRVKLRCEQCGGSMQREGAVIDCWFDSGSMPFAQWHYPFENKELFEQNFPADFISEAVDQTRGWFYTLLAISTVLFGCAPFKNCIVLGHVNDREGQKMSKHKGNVVDPAAIIDARGADAVRWYFYTGSAPWLPSRFYEEAVAEAQRKFMGTLWNTYAFYVLYANADQFNPAGHTLEYSKLSEMDRWVLSRLQTLIHTVDDHLNRYLITESGRAIAQFVDELSNWYVRRGRERYWGSELTQDKINAYMTLYTVLKTLCLLSAPFTPFLAENIYLNLVRRVEPAAPESVHLCDFPAYDPAWVDADLERNMAVVLSIVSLGRTCRNNAQIKNRQPLPRLYVDGATLPAAFFALVEDELNIKELVFGADAGSFISYNVKPQLKTLGPRYGKLLGAIRAHLLACDGTALVHALQQDGQAVIEVQGQSIPLSPEDVLIETTQRSGYFSASAGSISVALDTNLTPELLEEGFVREIISRVQAMRREADFNVTDHITLWYDGADEACAITERNTALIAQEVLADSVHRGAGEGFARGQDINGQAMTFAVQRL